MCLHRYDGHPTLYPISLVLGAGLEGEALLCEALRARGIAFWPEQQLRAEGFFKTPDVKLQARLDLTRSCLSPCQELHVSC